ncbi:MAG TPA: hypothetical protein VKO61_00720 [Candidatus Paceibacterota bacterium]|nr:hypothetical protein [Candidatus Paceibacterota bacterium]
MKKVKVRKVLVVDDRKENLEAARKAFGSDFDLVCVDDVDNAKREIVNAYERDKFDLVLSDMKMGDDKKAGMEVIETAYTYQIRLLLL